MYPEDGFDFPEETHSHTDTHRQPHTHTHTHTHTQVLICKLEPGGNPHPPRPLFLSSLKHAAKLASNYSTCATICYVNSSPLWALSRTRTRTHRQTNVHTH